jgi:chemotaxis protein CheD
MYEKRQKNFRRNNVNVVVGISDAKTSGNPEDVLVTHALGSCIGVALHDAKTGIGGMLHYQLPSAAEYPERSAERPLMFGDTAMTWLLDELIRRGADKRRLRVHVAGGAKMLNDCELFDIGRRNHAAIRKILWQRGMFIASENVGGRMPRTMLLRVADGTMIIKSEGKESIV